MKLEGKISQILPIEEGSSAKGTWRKQLFVVDVPSDFDKKVCFTLWGDKIDDNKLSLETEVEVHFNLSSREYNGRWYTEAKAWKVEQLGKPLAESNLQTLDNIDIDDGGLPF